MSISTTLFGEISHASLFFTGQLRNPWQMLAEPWGCAEPRLKNTVLTYAEDTFDFDQYKDARYKEVTQVAGSTLRDCQVTTLGRLFTHIVPLSTKQYKLALAALPGRLQQ